MSKTTHTKVSLASETVEILLAIGKAYAVDRLSPMREASLSGALQKAAALYIEEIKRARPDLLPTIEAVEQRYAEAQAAIEANRKVVPFGPPRKRGRPPKSRALES